MKRFLKYTLYLILYTLFFSSCEKIDNPYLPAPTGGGDTTVAVKVRKLLIEDFTGHKCGNCPGAATTIQTIKGIHGDKVISIALHTNFYAEPDLPPSPYTYDFRTSAGDEYDLFFQPFGWPAGMINRRHYPGNHWKNLSNWATIVDTLVAIPPDAYMEITNAYNSSTRQLNTSIRSEFLNPLNGTYKLIVLLTEDSIIKPQKFYVPAVDSLTYVHRHVLRDCLTAINFGDALISGTIAAGDTAVKTYNYTLPADFKGLAPNENHCAVVAYIYDAATYEVIQAEEKKIK